MENKRLLSTRIDGRTLEKVEAFVSRHRYWKRNTVISRVLDAVFDGFDEDAIEDMVLYSRLYGNKAKGTFSLVNKRGMQHD